MRPCWNIEMNLNQRIDQLELMDTISVPIEEMQETLRFLEITNRYFGGNAVILRHLNNWSKNWSPTETISVLDIGTGAGDIPMSIARWARNKGFSVAITAIDLVHDIVTIAKNSTAGWPNIRIEKADLFELASSHKKFDYVISSLLLHHIPTDQTDQALRAMNTLARRGIVVSDLHRTGWNYVLVHLLSHLIGNRLVRHDGPLSVRRAFRPAELNHLAERNNLPFLRGRTESWCRVSLAGEKS